MEDYRQRFQELLRRLFQFESADLDFGIYRIMNFKRGAIEKFIEKDLIKGVSAALDTGALADQADVVEQIKELAEQIGESLGDDAIDGDGNLHATPVMNPKWTMAQWQATLPKILTELYQVTAELGGTISGEHGIGHKRKAYLSLVMQPEAIELMRAIKRAWDPANILNPGKIFDR